MKKYWKLIAIGLITVISFTLFYLDIGSLSKQFPQFNINDIAGETTELNEVQIEGDLYFDTYFYEESFKVDELGTNYYRDIPYFKRLYETNQGPKIEKLATNHRNFMRGKTAYEDNFYEDDDIVAYVNETFGFGGLNSNKFVIDVLDKASNKATGFSLTIPDRSDYWYIEIKKVLVSDNNLYIITRNDSSDNMDSNEMQNSQVINVYNVDLTKQEVIDVAKIDVMNGVLKNTDAYMEIETIFSEDASSEFFVVANGSTYHEPEQNEVYSNDEYGFEEVKTVRAIKYNIQTNEQQEISLDEENSLGMLLHFDKETISFVKIEKEEVSFKKVNQTDNKVLIEKELEVKSQSSYDYLYAPIKNNKLYLLSTDYEPDEMTSVPLHVIDLMNFEIIYQGEVVLSELNIEQRGMYYYLNSVNTTE